MTESNARRVTADAGAPFTQVALAAMRGAITAEQRRRTGRWQTDVRLMNPRGTAARAITWFEEAAAAGGRPAEIVETFAERCDDEVAKARGLYTRRHLVTMIRIVGEMAERFEDES